MKICVVTPYFNTASAWMRQCHQSVRHQTIPAQHILVCDGSEPAQIEDFQGIHIILQRNYADYGNTPRLIGCYKAMAMGADVIAFLDGDNWYQPGHLENLLRVCLENKFDACSSTRTLHRADGSFLAKCPHVNGRPLIDTSCLMIMKPAFQHMIAWTFFPQDDIIPDQHVWRYMGNAGAKLGFFDNPSVCYRTHHAVHYRMAGEIPPADAIDLIPSATDHRR